VSEHIKHSAPRAIARTLLVFVFLLTACGSPSTPVPQQPTATASLIPTAVSVATASALAPEGTPNEVYYAPFPVAIKIDGDLGDWQDRKSVV
jgi:hypothetical protein